MTKMLGSPDCPLLRANGPTRTFIYLVRHRRRSPLAYIAAFQYDTFMAVHNSTNLRCAFTLVVVTSAALAAQVVSSVTDASYAMTEQRTRPSILPEIAQMHPVIDCVMSAPSKSEAQICLAKGGIEDAKSLPTDPQTVNEFKMLVLSFWLMLDRDPNRQLTSDGLLRSVGYARCVETAAYSNQGFSSRKKQQLEVALARAETACSSHPLSYRSLDPQNFEGATNLNERMFARALANIATKYALEANNWYPEEMRPCIRYLDGRPPSIGCSNESGAK
jgi:hypothetical protein